MFCRKRSNIQMLSSWLVLLIHLVQASSSFVIQPKTWTYLDKHSIGYEEARRVDESGNPVNTPNDKEPILLLNGFGVGSFHQHRLMPKILERDDRVVYGMDYLGQGRSWPLECNDGMSLQEQGLAYSADTWVDQTIQFIDQVILPQHTSKKVHVVGNSVGGYLAVHIACRRPDLLSSLCLMNATPLWGLNAPGWSGHLPAPKIPKKIGGYLFDRIRDIHTVDKYLDTCYANKHAFDETLKNQIVACTQGAGGHAAFASILWSPPATFSNDKSWYENLQDIPCDVLLLFGKQDPWCKPIFAKKMLRFLSKRASTMVLSKQQPPACRYVEVDPAGHCPNHEAPTACGKVLSKWVSADNQNEIALVEGRQEVFREPWADVAITEKGEEDIQVGKIDSLMAKFI